MMPEEERAEGYKIQIPKTDLKKGSYEIQINYSVGTNVNTYSTDSDSGYYHVKMGRQAIGLDPKKNECTFSLESQFDIKGYVVEINFSGESYIFVDEISIVETSYAKIKNLIIVIMLVLGFNTMWMLYRKKPEIFNKKNGTILILLGGTVLLASIPIFAPYLYSGHDLEFHLNRIEGIKNSIISGQIPARLHHSSLEGAGYPISVFYGDILLYIPAILRLLGWPVQEAYKGYILMINILSCVTMYKVLNNIFKDEWIGIFGSFVYLLAPYRLICIYMRAAVGEYTAISFYPLIVYGLYQIYTKKKKEINNGWIYLTIGFSGLILTHVISTFMASFFTLLFCLIAIKYTFKKEIFRELCKAVLTTVGICLWFILPFVDYMVSGVKATSDVLEGFFEGRTLTLNQLLTVFPHATGAAYSFFIELNETAEMALPLGGALALAPILFILYVLNREKKEENNKLGWMMFVFSLLSVLMTTAYFPWNEVEKLGGIVRYVIYNIQYPWRFLGIASVFLVFELAFVVNGGMKEQKVACYNVVTVLLVLVFISSNYFMTDYMNHAKKIYMVDEEDINSGAIGAGEYLPEDGEMYYVDVLYNSETIKIVETRKEKERYLIECSNLSDEPQFIQAPIINYKNYHAWDSITGDELRIENGEAHRIKIEIPGNYIGTIIIKYCSPWYWRLSEIISIITIIGAGSIFLRDKGMKYD